MRTLILLRGIPGIGKSSFIKKHNLDRFTISPDNLRLTLTAPAHTIEGNEIIPNNRDRIVWKFLFEALETRMERGDFTIIDATHSRSSLINRYKELKKKYRYRVYVVEFDNDLNKALEQNKKRLTENNGYKFVPESEIVKIHTRLKSDQVPGWVTKLSPDKFIEFMDKSLIYDFNKWEKIIIFGDIHSCYTPLKEYFDANPFNDKYFYIFTGDYFDRGIEVIETYNFISSLLDKHNVLLLEGNHERWIRKYIYDDPIKSRDAVKTFDHLKENNISKSNLKLISDKLGQVAYFTFNNKKYIVTHGGITAEPSLLWSTHEFINGIGTYADSTGVDKNFSNNNLNTYSIHGHRNVYKEPIHNTDNTYNLEGRIEFGGHLRLIEIDKNGITPIEIKNNIFNKNLRENFTVSKTKIDITDGDTDIIKSLKENRYIIKKYLFDNVYSFNFSKKAFRNRVWNNLTSRARGLFLNLDDNSIVARSYDKFFNWGELLVSSTDYLRNNLKYPVVAYKKYNGFLGILSVHKNDWFIASKSTIFMDFAGWFKKIITTHLSDKLKQYIIDNKVSLVFEVIDMERDPHMIKNEHDKVVILLDIIKNDMKEEVLPYNELVEFAKEYNFIVKEQLHKFDNFDELYAFRKEQQKKDPIIEDIEGYVFTDANNYRVKFKTNHYKFWKHIRSIKDRVVKLGGHSQEILNKLHTTNEYKVYNKMIEFDVTALKEMSILDIKEHFEGP